MGGLVTVRDTLPLLSRWGVEVLAGSSGMGGTVTWAGAMRPRLPAFEGFQGGEMALLSLAILRSLRGQLVTLSLADVIEQLAEVGAVALAVVGLNESGLPRQEYQRAVARAEERRLPLLGLAAGTSLPDVEREVIAFVVARRAADAQSAAIPSVLDAQRVRASLRAEALDALLSGTYAGEAQMRARAAQLGYDLTAPHFALWLELGGEAEPDGPTGGAPHPEATRLGEELTVALGAWVRVREREVVALLPLADRAGANMLERAEALIRRAVQGAWSAGVGEAAEAPAQVSRSAVEARDAARLGRLVLGERRVARPTDLGIYRLLLVLRDSGDLAPFVARTLAPLRANNSTADGLIETLDVYFVCNGNLSEAARRLHLHRNSLLYRLNRARDLMDHDLDDPDLRLALMLAVKGLRVLEL